MDELKKYLIEIGKDGLCIAYSGGVDSGLLLKLVKVLGIRALAVTFETTLGASKDISFAQNEAEKIGVEHIVIKMDPLKDEHVANNHIDRCYYCKSLLFKSLIKCANDRGFKTIIDGTNADDMKMYRPGLKALKELGVLSPLFVCGITKSQVRNFAKELNLSFSNKPSSPCLATRLPYNTPINIEIISKIEACEEFVKSNGFSVCRVRVYGDLVRLEVEKDKLLELLDKSELITKFIKSQGFNYVTLDLEGFRSSSMDIKIVK